MKSSLPTLHCHTFVLVLARAALTSVSSFWTTLSALSHFLSHALSPTCLSHRDCAPSPYARSARISVTSLDQAGTDTFARAFAGSELLNLEGVGMDVTGSGYPSADNVSVLWLPEQSSRLPIGPRSALREFRLRRSTIATRYVCGLIIALCCIVLAVFTRFLCQLRWTLLSCQRIACLFNLVILPYLGACRGDRPPWATRFRYRQEPSRSDNAARSGSQLRQLVVTLCIRTPSWTARLWSVYSRGSALRRRFRKGGGWGAVELALGHGFARQHSFVNATSSSLVLLGC